ncbi:hypothetical protein [Gloeothece verrucosa]|uniref:Uncharacterized protein n=1 Tax=Gloeothece verrucosa (strain PCC 7822) TaxID=497965 RepID=E0ULY9_GLOV7|nr:hypothetical protein [Gloeothece verrucosa]ADN17969.1 hypothetical protein Cyan7822_6138 [Gloeothece verrucosa PCC 7822]
MLTTDNHLVINTNDSTFDEFDVIALENAIEVAYNAENTPFCDYEIDAELEFGTYLYCIWWGRTRLGCFYRSPMTDEWVARPFYKNGEFMYEPNEQRFISHKDAEAHIIRCWEG